MGLDEDSREDFGSDDEYLAEMIGWHDWVHRLRGVCTHRH